VAPVLTSAERAGLHDLLAEHLTLTDIHESMQELRYYRSTVFVPDPGPTSEQALWVARGGCRSAGRAPGCGPGCRGFETRYSPHFDAESGGA